MTQSIVVQVGQCGNQIGSRFWDLALREHAIINSAGNYDDALKSFFYDSSAEKNCRQQQISSLKARAILVDMEEGVISEILRGPMRDIFDSTQVVTDVSGSGNNWAVGNLYYGQMYEDHILSLIRKQVEMCDSLQCFFLLHSMGGGSGSGIGTSILSMLHDHFPDVHRFCIPIYPSENDDVVTSPYNTTLAMEQLTSHADCVVPLENQALLNVCEKISKSSSCKKGTELNNFGSQSKKKPFDEMNNIAANLILHLTSSSRFGGNLNVDMNEVVVNMVPFPKVHYLMSGLCPLYLPSDIKLRNSKIDGMFTDVVSWDHQLVKVYPSSHNSVCLASALLARGDITVSDLQKNIQRLNSKMNFIPWNKEGWKVGICKTRSFSHPRSLLSLSNNTCIRHNFASIRYNFWKLFKRKAHIHHYTEVAGMDNYMFESSLESLDDLIENYKALEEQAINNCIFPRLKIYS